MTFSSEGVLQQMRVLITSTQPYLQNKTDPGQKYFEMKKLQTVEDGRQNDFFPISNLLNEEKVVLPTIFNHL